MHDQATYHKEAVEAGRNFFKNYNEPAINIVNRLNAQRLEQVLENRQRLTPIVESVIFLGRQNIPFRGHRDDGSLLDIDDEDSEVMTNEGNFRELLRYRVSGGDSNLENHLKTASASATYISKTTQNALIECCGEEICEKILSRVRESKYYAVMFDETTDASHKSQMTIILRYLMLDGSLREDFVGFVDLHEKNYQSENIDNDTEVTELVTEVTEPVLTGEIIGQSVVDMLVNKFNLPLENCVGVGTDGCSVMSSVQKGAVVEIQKVAVNAVWCPCYNHALNLTLSKSSNVQAIRNCLGVISEVVAFFNASAKRNFIIKRMLKSQLVSLSETRWVERHDALLTFNVELPKIFDALDSISKWNDRTTSSKARTLLSAIRESDFIVSLRCAVHVFSLTKSLSELFQKKSLDLLDAKNCIKDLLDVLQQKRENCEEMFAEIFKAAEKTIIEKNCSFTYKRMVQRQTCRDNVPSDTLEEYYRRSIYIPLLDALILDINTRFSKENLRCLELYSLMPENIIKLNHKNVVETVAAISNIYGVILGLSTQHSPALEFISEVELWQRKCLRIKEEGGVKSLPTDLSVVFDLCDQVQYPITHELFRIIKTCPVSVASAERSFSTLRRIKTWLRTRMSEDRLVGLALLNVHRDIVVDVGNVIERFAKSGNRKLDFVL